MNYWILSYKDLYTIGKDFIQYSAQTRKLNNQILWQKYLQAIDGGEKKHENAEIFAIFNMFKSTLNNLVDSKNKHLLITIFGTTKDIGVANLNTDNNFLKTRSELYLQTHHQK